MRTSITDYPKRKFAAIPRERVPPTITNHQPTNSTPISDTQNATHPQTQSSNSTLLLKNTYSQTQDPASQPSNDNASSDPEDPPTHRRRTEDSPASNTDPDTDSSDNDEPRAPSSTDVMVKKLVRLALASEYSRQPIRRNDITTKVLAEQGSRPFKTVFEESQKSLRKWFGMEMVELPQKEKVTISQRRGMFYSGHEPGCVRY